MSARIRATTFGALALLLPAAFSTGARAALAYPTPAPSVIAELRHQYRPKDWLRVTTDSARFVTRARVVNEYGLVGLSIADRDPRRPTQVPWARIARIDVETNHRALVQFITTMVFAGIELASLPSAPSTTFSIAAAGGSLLAGAIGTRMLHERPLYVAPVPTADPALLVHPSPPSPDVHRAP